MFLTLIHIHVGSTVEAANAAHTVGPFPTREKAEAAGDKIYRAVSHIQTLHDCLFHTVVEIPHQPVSANIAAALILDEWEEEDEDDDTAPAVEIEATSMQDFMSQLGGLLGGSPPQPGSPGDPGIEDLDHLAQTTGAQVEIVDEDEDEDEDEPEGEELETELPSELPKTKEELEALVSQMMDEEDSDKVPPPKVDPAKILGQGDFFGGKA